MPIKIINVTHGNGKQLSQEDAESILRTIEKMAGEKGTVQMLTLNSYGKPSQLLIVP